MTVKELIAELQKYPGDLKVCFDTEGNHQSCFVEVDYVFGEYCINHGFIGMGTAAAHSAVAGEKDLQVPAPPTPIVTGDCLRHPKDFPSILSDRDYKQGPIVAEIDKELR